jgi:plastocyanin
MRVRYTVIALSLPVVAAVVWLGLAGTGSFAESKPKPGDCKPNGTALSLTASDNKFDKDCMAVPANQASTIAFENRDPGIPHNVSIYQDDTASKAYFKGEVIDGPKKITYNVPALPEGRYFFRCDPHPEFMYGNFVVGNPPPAPTTTTTAPPPTTTTTSGPGLPLPKLFPSGGSAR